MIAAKQEGTNTTVSCSGPVFGTTLGRAAVALPSSRLSGLLSLVCARLALGDRHVGLWGEDQTLLTRVSVEEMSLLRASYNSG